MVFDLEDEAVGCACNDKAIDLAFEEGDKVFDFEDEAVTFTFEEAAGYDFKVEADCTVLEGPGAGDANGFGFFRRAAMRTDSIDILAFLII